jgi:hypothetical protein
MFIVKVTALFFFHCLTFEYESIIILQNVRSHLLNDIPSYSTQHESSNWITFGIGSFPPENVNVFRFDPATANVAALTSGYKLTIQPSDDGASHTEVPSFWICTSINV